MTSWIFRVLYFALCIQTMGCGAAKAAEVTLLYTGGTQSFLEVCGCTDNQLGGVARRAAAVRDLKHTRADVLLLDAGDLFAGDTALDRLRCRVHLDAMRDMGYDAALAGEDAFRFGEAYFASVRDSAGVSFVSANLAVKDKTVVPAFRIFGRGGVRIGVIGVGGIWQQPSEHSMGTASLVLPKDVGVKPAIVSVQKALREMPAVDLVVVLSDLTREDERALVGAISDVDVVISARSNVAMERVNEAVLLGTQPQGKALGRAVLTLVQGRLAQVQPMWVWLTEQMTEDATVKRLVDGFYTEVNARSELQAVGRPRFEGFAHEAQVVAGKNGYAGAEACKSCHEREYVDWSQTHHASAYNTLLQKQKHYQPDCVTCHTTGFGYPTGFRIGGGQSALTGVQCEVCHGPGGRHVQRPEAVNIRKTPPKDLCQRCHDTNQTPDLDTRFSEMVTHVNHSGHGVSAEEAVQAAVQKTKGKPEVELFVMADCPYGVRAETMLAPVIRMMGDQIDFKLFFIADEVGVDATPAVVAQPTRRQTPGCSGTTTTGTGRFRSLHGDTEVAEGIRQTVVMQLYPNQFWEYILCRNQHGIDADWRACAVQSGLDADRIAALAESAEGENLFSQNIRRANALGITGSPTLWVNGKEVNVHFDPVGLTRLLCQQGTDAALCAQTPACGQDGDCLQAGKIGICVNANLPTAKCEFRAPKSFGVTIVNDATCEVCETYPFVRSTMSLFPGAQFETVDVHSAAGRALVAKYQLDRVPSFVLGKGFEETARFDRFSRTVWPVEDAYLPDVRMTPVSRLLQSTPEAERVDVFLNLSAASSWGVAERLLRWAGEVNAPDRLRLHFLGDGEDLTFRRFQQMMPNRVGDVLMCRVLERKNQAITQDACWQPFGGKPEALAYVSDENLWQTTKARAHALGIRPDMAPAVVIDGQVVLLGSGLAQVETVFYRLHPAVAQREKGTDNTGVSQ